MSPLLLVAIHLAGNEHGRAGIKVAASDSGKEIDGPRATGRHRDSQYFRHPSASVGGEGGADCSW